ncbi:MAG: site-2 protease family protein [Armatimonadota bacterium]|nr:site-2 protease family protein [Armatimonadota bacterium]
MSGPWAGRAQALGVIGATVALHELAHAAVARAVGGQVREVALGFGPPVARGRIGGTTLSLRPVPLGGFAAIDIDRLPPARRLPVLLAGPLANLAVGFVLRALGDRRGPDRLPGQRRAVEVGGLLAALAMLQQAASMGPQALVRTAGVLNFSVGLANLLPLVPLDGGHLAMARMEAAGVSPAARRWFRRLTVGLFVGLVARVFFADLARLVQASRS